MSRARIDTDSAHIYSVPIHWNGDQERNDEDE